MPKGWGVMLKQAGQILADTERCQVPELLRGALLDQVQQIRTLSEQIRSLERGIAAWHRLAEQCQQFAAIPGMRLLTATAVVATMGNPGVFHSGRQFLAFIGLVPRHFGTGGRVKILGISKRGDRYSRTLLIHGARSVLHSQREANPWLTGLLARMWQLSRLPTRRPG